MGNIIGAVFCVVGCGGYGISYILSKRREVNMYQTLYRAFLRMKNMLLTDRDFISEALLKLGQDTRIQNKKIRLFFQNLGQDSNNYYEMEISDLWRREVKEQWSGDMKEKELYDLFYSFPSYIENCDLNSLEYSYSYFLKQWEELMGQCQREQRKNEKLVFTICLFGGFMLSIFML